MFLLVFLYIYSSIKHLPLFIFMFWWCSLCVSVVFHHLSYVSLFNTLWWYSLCVVVFHRLQLHIRFFAFCFVLFMFVCTFWWRFDCLVVFLFLSYIFLFCTFWWYSLCVLVFHHQRFIRFCFFFWYIWRSQIIINVNEWHTGNVSTPLCEFHSRRQEEENASYIK